MPNFSNTLPMPKKQAELLPWLEQQRMNYYQTPVQHVYQDPNLPP